MRHVLIVVAVVGLAVLALSCSASRVQLAGTSYRPRKAMVQQALRSSVRVQVWSGETLRRTASGVVIDVAEVNGAFTSYVATNEHVVETDDVPNASFRVLVDGKPKAAVHVASVVAEGKVPAVDLAVIAVPGVKLEPAQLATDDEAEVGDDVLVIGAPYGRGLSVSGGMLSQVELADGSPSMLKTDAPVSYGASGGGVFSAETGHLLGIIEGYRTAQVQVPAEGKDQGFSFDVPMPGETFAAPMAKLRKFAMEKRVPGFNASLATR